MLLIEEQKLRLAALKLKLPALKQALEQERLTLRLQELEVKTAQNDFWDDAASSGVVLKEMGGIKDTLQRLQELDVAFEDAETLILLAIEDSDESLTDEIVAEVDRIDTTMEDMRLATLLSGEFDKNNAIITFHPGAGGTESQDWAQMLYRMYIRFAARHGFSHKVLEYQDGDEAGLKSASILISGTNAYGYLKGENGVHRLVRISPFDSSGRRHTSFASLEVVPEIVDDNNDIQINPEDLRVDTYRASGAGGQHVNKTESAVRITHIPTGIVVACQNERSQFQNRDVCMRMLKSKLVQIKQREHLERIEDIKGEQKEITWGSQIRSYVFMPYTMVKDHRTAAESGNVSAVMDGDLDLFVNAYLSALSQGSL